MQQVSHQPTAVKSTFSFMLLWKAVRKSCRLQYGALAVHTSNFSSTLCERKTKCFCCAEFYRFNFIFTTYAVTKTKASGQEAFREVYNNTTKPRLSQLRHRSLVVTAFQTRLTFKGGSRRILRCEFDLIDDCAHAFVITLFELIAHSHRCAKKKIICRFVLGCWT